MGCIEICLFGLFDYIIDVFNRNMGCIEILLSLLEVLVLVRLIETWDVLKFFRCDRVNYNDVSLIETWDVLKLVQEECLS